MAQKRFPQATGLALETVNAHSKEQELVLWGSWLCPFVQRVWIALEEKGIPYQYHEVDLQNKEKAFLDVNPLGLVPAFEIKGKAALYESLVLLEYLEDAYPNNHSLLPEDPIDRAKARIWIDHIVKKILPAFFSVLQAEDLEKREEAKDRLFEGLQKFTKQLAPSSSGPYFFGDRYTIADIALTPWAFRIPLALKTFKNIEIPTSGGEGDVWSRFKEWTDAVVTRASVKRTTSDVEGYLEMYSRYADNTAQSEVAKATREGKPLP